MMKWLGGFLLVLVLALTFCVISCNADDDDDDTTDDDDQDDDTSDDDIDDDADDDDEYRELIVDSGNGSDGCMCDNDLSDGGRLGNVFDPGVPTTLYGFKIMFSNCLETGGDQPAPFYLYVYNAYSWGEPDGGALYSQSFTPADEWDTWQFFTFQTPIDVASLDQYPQFGLFFGPGEGIEDEACIAKETIENDVSWHYSNYDHEWGQYTDRVFLIRAIVRP